jgi:hypothetical protein
MLTYLAFIGSFAVWFLRMIILRKNSLHDQKILILALFSAWTTIQITNFFGFSVVIIGLFFFLIPAFSFILEKEDTPSAVNHRSKSSSKWVILGAITILAIIMESNLLNMWRADKAYAYGKNLGSSQVREYLSALPYLLEAVSLNPDEPTFRDELSYNQAVIASALYQKIEESTASSIINLTKDQKLALKFPAINLSTQDLISSATEEPPTLIAFLIILFIAL